MIRPEVDHQTLGKAKLRGIFPSKLSNHHEIDDGILDLSGLPHWEWTLCHFSTLCPGNIDGPFTSAQYLGG
jgi:hypothetical protein